MNKLKSLFLLGAVAVSSVTFVSCKKDSVDDGTESSKKPTLVLNGAGNYVAGNKTMEVGSNFQVAVSGSSNTNTDAKLTNLKITRITNNTPTVVVDSNFSEKTFNEVVYNFTAMATAGTEKFVITLTDKDNNSDEESFTITTYTPFSMEFTNGTLFHINGPNPGAFDLVGDRSRLVGDDDSDKDLENSDNSGTWTGSWASLNQTTFVKAPNSAAYDNANQTSVMGAFNAINNGSTTVSNPAVGDVYYVHLRNTGVAGVSGDYAVIKITEKTGTGNGGSLKFSYKK